jgi:c(7)-type cytochrome triheme protein
MKTILILISLLSFVMLSGPAMGAPSNMGAGQIILAGGKRGDIAFPHHLHQDKLKDCNRCHSLFPQQKQAIEKLKSEGTLKAKQVMNKLCVACHRSERNAGRPGGPTLCSKCHSMK